MTHSLGMISRMLPLEANTQWPAYFCVPAQTKNLKTVLFSGFLFFL